MKTSDQIDQIAIALSTSQAEFGVIEKTGKNPRFNSKYAKLEDILSVCIPVLSKNGIAFIQGIGWENGRLIITTRMVHKSGQWLET